MSLKDVTVLGGQEESPGRPGAPVWWGVRDSRVKEFPRMARELSVLVEGRG